MGLSFGQLVAVMPGGRDHDQDAEADGPRQVGPRSLLIMSGRLVPERGVEHNPVKRQEAAHAQEEGSLDGMETEQAPNQKTQGDQAKEKNPRMQGTDLHRLSCGLPAGGNIDLRQLNGKGERAHLRKIADSQPTVSLAWIP